ncbi:MAG: prenyltransferase/squalene oxidase repeat-containing protein [Pirellulaceae bacterium]
MHRRNLLTAAATAGLAMGTPRPLRSLVALATPPRDEKVKSVEELVTSETSAAIDRGLEFLANSQVMSGGVAGAFGQAGYASGVAVTALAGLAFMCNGSTPLGGKYADHINRCTRYMLRCTRQSGYIASGGSHQSNMYGHGYAMLYLSQVYGMSGSQAVSEKLHQAVAMTCDVQNDNGGWRYQPAKQPGDLSITICQIMALRAAHDAGLHVAEEVRDKTLDYVYKSQTADGSFQYMLRGGRVSLALTAAGVVSLYSAGVYEGEAVEKALDWLMERLPGTRGGQNASPMNYFYAHYYAVQAMWHAQQNHPDYWNAWYPAIRDELLGMCGRGVWDDHQIGREFASAMACIILQIPYNFVPVFAP